MCLQPSFAQDLGGSMNLKELRDTLIMKKGEYNEAVKVANRTANEISDIVGNLKDEDYAFMEELGINGHFIANLDLEKLTTDREYLEQIKQYLDVSIEKLTNDLEERLCMK